MSADVSAFFFFSPQCRAVKCRQKSNLSNSQDKIFSEKGSRFVSRITQKLLTYFHKTRMEDGSLPRIDGVNLGEETDSGFDLLVSYMHGY